MPQYELREQGYTFDTVEADDVDDALETLDGTLSYSDYNSDGDTTGTLFIEIHAFNAEDTDDHGSRTFVLEPPEPTCTADEHDWQSPIEVVGGIKENPGVVGHGGGVVCVECCMHCGCKRTTDTWATDPSNGTQGHVTITYDALFFAEDVEALRDEQNEEAALKGAMPPPKRPRLTRKVIEALRSVSSDAEVMLDERSGTSSEFSTDEAAYRGLEYLSALFAWYDATHPESRPAEHAPPAHEPPHHPSCVLPNGHVGECVPLSDLADIDPRNGGLLSRGAVKAAQTRLERTNRAKKPPR